MRRLVGVVVCAASIALASSALYWLLLVGTCASGGPYVSARPCPDGTGLHVVMLTGGIFGVLIGAALAGVGRWAWLLGFDALAAAFALAGFGPETADPSTGWRVFTGLMAGFFFLMAIPALLLRGVRTPARAGTSGVAAVVTAAASEAAAAPAPAPATGDPAPTMATVAERLRDLNELRTSGVLTDEEFAAAKDRLLASEEPAGDA